MILITTITDDQEIALINRLESIVSSYNDGQGDNIQIPNHWVFSTEFQKWLPDYPSGYVFSASYASHLLQHVSISRYRILKSKIKEVKQQIAEVLVQLVRQG